jgi:hypothetical protein
MLEVVRDVYVPVIAGLSGAACQGFHQLLVYTWPVPPTCRTGRTGSTTAQKWLPQGCKHAQQGHCIKVYTWPVPPNL